MLGSVQSATSAPEVPNLTQIILEVLYHWCMRSRIFSSILFTQFRLVSSFLVLPPTTSCQHRSMSTHLRAINELTFDNRNINTLPVDPNVSKKCRPVANSIFSIVEPTPVSRPVLVAASTSALEDLLGLSSSDENELAQYLSGNKIIPGSRPAAHCYCGHQFGNFAGQLGDGATMYLGEVVNPVTHKRWELQLKGAGKTPYSRTADGRKVLRSSVREFLCSEAMHYLGVPTTRAGSCVTSSSTVQRDPMYDGGVIDEQCTVISRIASNFFRFGSFEIFKGTAGDGDHDGRAGPSAGNEALKQQLLNHILLYYPDITATAATPTQQYEAGFREITRRTAYLVAKWQCLGFVHGVLNTDNMSIMGLTIDYGPYGFVEHFDPQYVPNGSDGSARYSYQEQPQICKWNLGKLAEVLQPLLSAEASAAVLRDYDAIYQEYYSTLMGAKFGFVLPTTPVAVDFTKMDEVPTAPGFEARSPSSPESTQLVAEFFTAMAATSTDFTDAFVALTEHVEALAQLSTSSTTSTAAAQAETQALTDTLIDKLVSRSAPPDNIIQALRRKIRIHRLGMHPGQIEQIYAMLQTSSAAQLSHLFGGAPVDAIRDEIMGEKRKLDILVAASTGIKRYEQTSSAAKAQSDREHWTAWCNKYTTHLLQLSLSGSTSDYYTSAAHTMRTQNPTFILRNWLAQDAIKLAEDSADYSGVRVLLDMLREPYNAAHSTFRNASTTCSTAAATASTADKSEVLRRKYVGTPPDWADSLICTCSS